MPTLQFIIAAGAVFTLGLKGVLYLRDVRNSLDIMIDLQWKTIEILAHITSDAELMDGIRARSGAIIRPPDKRSNGRTSFGGLRPNA